MGYELMFVTRREGATITAIRSEYLRASNRRARASARHEFTRDFALASFMQALESRYPQPEALSNDLAASSPWASPFRLSANSLIVDIRFGQGDALGDHVAELLRSHPIIIYDPQSDSLHIGEADADAVSERVTLLQPVAVTRAPQPPALSSSRPLRKHLALSR